MKPNLGRTNYPMAIPDRKRTRDCLALIGPGSVGLDRGTLQQDGDVKYIGGKLYFR